MARSGRLTGADFTILYTCEFFDLGGSEPSPTFVEPFAFEPAYPGRRRGVVPRRILVCMTHEYEFAILNIRQAALENEADAAQFVEELAAELGVEGAWERTEITNLVAEGTGEAIRFPAVSQAALKAAVDGSPNCEKVARYFLVPTS